MHAERTASGFDYSDLCVYCGAPAQGVDHIVPRAFYSQAAEVLGPLNRLVAAFGATVPACTQCNAMLGPEALFTMTERRARVKECLRKRYRRLLASPDWTEQELSELGADLRQHVLEGMAFKETIRRRIRWPEK